jgi:hypothetical protein
MTDFPTWDSFGIFQRSVRNKARYFRSSENEKFLKTLQAKAESIR